jgi:hypothetical protein
VRVLWVQTSGSRLWQLIYRFNLEQRQVSSGAYPFTVAGDIS